MGPVDINFSSVLSSFIFHIYKILYVKSTLMFPRTSTLKRRGPYPYVRGNLAQNI